MTDTSVGSALGRSAAALPGHWAEAAAQDQLTGYEFVQWPAADRTVLAPELRDGRAVWTLRGAVVAEIGELTPHPGHGTPTTG